MWMSVAVCLNYGFLQLWNSYNIMGLQLYCRNKCLLSLLNQETVWADFVRADPDWSSQHLCCSLSFDQGSVRCVGEGGEGTGADLSPSWVSGAVKDYIIHEVTIVAPGVAVSVWLRPPQHKSDELNLHRTKGQKRLGFRSNHWPTALTVDNFDSSCFMKRIFRNHTHHMILKESVLNPPVTYITVYNHLLLALSVVFLLPLFFFPCCPLYCFELKLWVIQIPS